MMESETEKPITVKNINNGKKPWHRETNYTER